MLPFKFEALSRRMCKTSRHQDSLHFCIIVKGGAILSMATNGDQYHPDGRTHAEIRALMDLWPSKRKGTKLWSVRLLKTGSFGMARPCPKCAAEIKAAGVKTVFYTDNNGAVQMMKP